MSEKRGQTEKLRYDFNTAQAVYVKRDNKMYRVTERDFRSYFGDRYIYTKQSNGEYEYVSYDGPIYYHNTNKKCKEPIGVGLIQYAHNQPWVTYVRPHEKHLV